MAPRPGWCANKNSWDPANGTCFTPAGQEITAPGTEQPECNCADIAYEKGHRCYKQCNDEREGNGGDDHAWYVREIQSKPNQYDTGISEGQWIAWRGFWDEATKSFRNENVDASGNAIGGTGFNKPVDCPGGTTKFNVNQCLPLDDWRITSAWGTQPQGGGGGGGGGRGAQAAPAKTSKDLAVSQLPYTGEELHDVLANFFNYRSGIFGTNDPNLSGATSRAGKDAAGRDTDIKAYDLPGGGIWWGEGKSLADALAPFGSLYDSSKKTNAFSMSSPIAPKATPTTHTCPAGYKWSTSVNACMPEVTGQPAQTPVEFTGPLAAALNKEQITV
jgi:hypothetical protein